MPRGNFASGQGGQRGFGLSGFERHEKTTRSLRIE
jgi:hypothetical protein